MRTVDKVVLISFTLAGALAIAAHYDTRSDCLAMVKPKTDSTPRRVVSKFTGEYKRLGGVLFCRDKRGILHAYREGK